MTMGIDGSITVVEDEIVARVTGTMTMTTIH
jgi:hypothetical protein